MTGERSELVHRQAEPVGARDRILLQQALLGEGGQQAVRRALADAESAGELGDADLAVCRGRTP